MYMSYPMVPTQDRLFLGFWSQSGLGWKGLQRAPGSLSPATGRERHLPSSAHILSFPFIVDGSKFTAYVSRKSTINMILDQNTTIKEKKTFCAPFVIFRACSFVGSNCSLIETHFSLQRSFLLSGLSCSLVMWTVSASSYQALTSGTIYQQIKWDRSSQAESLIDII